MTKPAARRIVGVISSRADLRRALSMRTPPDLFELRLDGLIRIIDTVHATIEQLPSPLIITARDPAEGGANNLSSKQRRALLLEFLPHAAYVDVELRAAPFFREVLRTAHTRKIQSIISFHDLRGTPSAMRLDHLASAARSLGAAILKFATRTDTTSQMHRLLDFFDRQGDPTKIVAMGIGKLGPACRRELFRRGCVLNYAPIGRRQVAGQLTIAQIRKLERRLTSSRPAAPPN
ncbi:MAG TPA: type I 3-dehydroquinate dehydratase [Chthoniobacterales bacterium]|nr:type I 3-dehydroquinate dehydratase [Chthoniobacterales bacterium]